MKNTLLYYVAMATAASLFLINAGAFATETDDRIVSSVQETYVFKTFLKDDDINVQSKDGVVTLTGTVSEETHKLLAKETAASLPGVKSVDDKLTINQDAPAAASDAWLITKVKATLLFHRNVSATSTEVLAKDGIITLRGNADNLAQKHLTAEYARDVDGVKDVNNEMTVSKPAIQPIIQPDDKTMGEKMDTVIESVDDASITALVKMTLLYHRSTSALKTTVTTKEGVVTLGGTTKNTCEKDLAARIVSDVHGVQRVVNTLVVE